MSMLVESVRFFPIFLQKKTLQIFLIDQSFALNCLNIRVTSKTS